MKRLEIELGSKYDRWTIQEEKPSVNGRRYVIVKCDCGNERLVNLQSIVRGSSKCCGCVGAERFGELNKSHQLSKTPEYIAWKSMKSRCYNPNYTNYKYWGGKGVIVCDRWVNSFENFIQDMGEKPFKEYSLDRIDGNGNYEPSNCRWVDRDTQIKNRKNYKKK